MCNKLMISSPRARPATPPPSPSTLQITTVANNALNYHALVTELEPARLHTLLIFVRAIIIQRMLIHCAN